MSRILVEHFADGRARYVIADMGTTVAALARDIPVVSECVQQIGGGPWAVGEPACWSCGFAWVALMPEGGRDAGLECPGCGEKTGALPAHAWCGSCGTEGRTVMPPEAPRDGVECWSCHQPSMMVEA